MPQKQTIKIIIFVLIQIMLTVQLIRAGEMNAPNLKICSAPSVMLAPKLLIEHKALHDLCRNLMKNQKKQGALFRLTKEKNNLNYKKITKTMKKEVVKIINLFITNTKSNLSSSNNTLKRMVEYEAPKEMIDRQRRISERYKNDIEAAQELKENIKDITTFKKLINVIRQYTTAPTPAQTEIMNALKKVLPDFNKELVFFFEESLITKIFNLSYDRTSYKPLASFNGKNFGFTFVPAGQTVLAGPEGPIVFNARTAKTLIHEEVHRIGPAHFKSELERFVFEGITAYLEEKVIAKIMRGKSKIAKIFKQDPLFMMLWTFSASSGYENELLFVKALVEKFGEDFVEQLYTSGDILLLKDKMGAEFDVLWILAQHAVGAAWNEYWAWQREVHCFMALTFKNDKLDLERTNAFLSVIKRLEKIRESIFDVEDDDYLPVAWHKDFDKIHPILMRAIYDAGLTIKFTNALIKKKFTGEELEKLLKKEAMEIWRSALDKYDKETASYFEKIKQKIAPDQFLVEQAI